MGRKTVSNYLYPEEVSYNSAINTNPPVNTVEYKDTENAGTISCTFFMILVFFF